jgi:hypothetical protein
MSRHLAIALALMGVLGASNVGLAQEPPTPLKQNLSETGPVVNSQAAGLYDIHAGTEQLESKPQGAEELRQVTNSIQVESGSGSLNPLGFLNATPPPPTASSANAAVKPTEIFRFNSSTPDNRGAKIPFQNF